MLKQRLNIVLMSAAAACGRKSAARRRRAVPRNRSFFRSFFRNIFSSFFRNIFRRICNRRILCRCKQIRHIVRRPVITAAARVSAPVNIPPPCRAAFGADVAHTLPFRSHILLQQHNIAADVCYRFVDGGQRRLCNRPGAHIRSPACRSRRAIKQHLQQQPLLFPGQPRNNIFEIGMKNNLIHLFPRCHELPLAHKPAAPGSLPAQSAARAETPAASLSDSPIKVVQIVR